LRQALAACRSGDTLVVTKLDRLARSVPDARDIVDELTANGVKLNISGSVHDPTDPIGRLLFTTLSMIAEFEADLARARTREGMAVARAKGRCGASNPSSVRGKRRTSLSSTAPEGTPSASSRSCFRSPARRSIGPSRVRAGERPGRPHRAQRDD
jgi:DNA invertase Pin-like site-specific DNA recombinase